MASTYTSELRIEKIATGEQSGTWGTTTNTQYDNWEASISGTVTVAWATDADDALTTANGTDDEARHMFLDFTGGATLTATRNMVVPSSSKLYFVSNQTTGGQSIVIKTAAGTGITVPTTKFMALYCDGTNVIDAMDYVNITGGTITGITDLVVADGGTGASTAADARVNLLPSYTGNGSKVLSLNSGATDVEWATSSGGGGTTYVVKTANYTMADLEGVLANTSAGSFTVTLPATPSVGSQCIIADDASTFGTNNLTVGRNGSTIEGTAADLVLDINGVSVQFIYNGTTWNVFAQIGGNGGTGVNIEVSTTAPVAPFDGDLWWDSTAGRLKIYYDDGNTSQWVDASPAGSGFDPAAPGAIGATTPSTGAFTTLSASSLLQVAAAGRFTGNGLAGATGAGVELLHDATTGTIASYNRTTSAYKALNIDALSTNLQVSGSTIAAVSSTGLAVTGALSASGTATGFPTVLQLRAFVNASNSSGANLAWTQANGTVGLNMFTDANGGTSRILSQGPLTLHSGTTGITGANEVVSIISSGVTVTGTLNITGALSKGSGSFRIEHPLPSKSATHQLVHSFIEGPKADLIYRGKVALVGGKASVNIDAAATMTEGTFEVLCRDVQCFTTNETGWTAVRGNVVGNILTLEAQDSSSTDTVSWMVIGERKDPHIMETDWTDENGRVIVEPLKPEKSN